MGGPRAGADTQSLATSTSSAGSAERSSLPGRRRWAVLAAYVLAGAALFTVYLRLSETSTLNSDSANILLMGRDLLHGHLLLHGWYMSDVSFYPTELPQYALLESLLGLHMQTAHVAAAMTYTLTFVLAVLLARSGSTGREATTRTLIAAGIMLAPQIGFGVFALDLSVGHIGTAVPLLLTWLLLDKARLRWPGGTTPPVPPARTWYVPVLTAVLLTWVLVADPIVYVVGVVPLGLACAVRVVKGLITGRGRWSVRIAGVWYELSLAAAAAAAAGMAWVVTTILSRLGGFTVNRLPFYFRSLHNLPHNAPAAWKVLTIFGANYAGLSGVWLVLAFLHMASVIAVGWAVLRVAWRFFGDVSLVDQVLAVAIVANVALFLLTNAADLAAHEVAIIVPFGAALAARVLIGRVRAVKGAAAKDGNQDTASSGLARRVRLAGLAAGILVLAGYTAGLGYELTQPSAPPANIPLASWLEAHHLTYGLSGYWTSSSVTVDSGDRVQVRALMQYSMKRDLWMSNINWYNPKLHYANFIVLDSKPGFMNHWEPRALIRKYFGWPAQVYQTGPYTVMVWNTNLLKSIPR
jgi:hypothetical protein